MLIIGSHVGFNRETQILGSLKEALHYGSNTFMFYTGAPQNTIRYPINKEIVKDAQKTMKEYNVNYDNIIVHAPYIINLANKIDVSKFDFSVYFLKEELKRCKSLEIKYLVLHPGSHVNKGLNIGIENIIEGLNKVLEDSDVMILLETMSGKGTEVGKTFEEIKQIINGVKHKDKIGVCLDTCHLHDAGYDMNDFDKLLNEFDEIIGIQYIKCIHINDSKNERGSKKDRHENIGKGYIGFDNLMKVIYNKKLEHIPKILETPYIDSNPPYKEEIECIKNKKMVS